MATRQLTEESNQLGSRASFLSREWRSLLAVALLVLEVFYLRRSFTTDHLLSVDVWWARLLVLSRYVMPFSLCLVAGMGFASGSRLLSFYRGESGQGSRPRSSLPWVVWLLVHGLCYGACLATASYLFRADPEQANWLGLSALGFGLCLLALLTSLAAIVVPLRGFLQLLWSERWRLSMGLLGGLVLYGIGNSVLGEMPFWRPMGAGTMWLAYHFLGLVYAERILDPEVLRIGTPEFDVLISRYCSGYEGAFLFLGFFGLFLYLSRSRVRFPRILWLLPLGIASVYLINSLRIAILIVVGTEFSQELAMEGFHVNAGWPFFGITAWLAVLVGIRSPYFSKVERRQRLDPQQATVNLYAVYLAPMVVAIGAVMLSNSVTRLEWVGDLVKLIGVALVAYLYRKEYRHLLRGLTAFGPIFALLACVTWMLLYDGEPTARWELGVIYPRLLGFMLVAPLAEELAFRGFLMRRLAADDFEAVEVRSIGPWPLVSSSVIFGLFHEQWLAGAACGLLFALAYRIRGRLGDALLAHMLTNLALVMAAASTGDWGQVS